MQEGEELEDVPSGSEKGEGVKGLARIQIIVRLGFEGWERGKMHKGACGWVSAAASRTSAQEP